LARAFLFAGAKALLVSNSYAASDEAARSMASTFDIFARDPSIGRAEALRRAMINALDQAPTTERTHPLFWAPFVVVGNGGPSR
jgi:CHAT domain-containing protein